MTNIKVGDRVKVVNTAGFYARMAGKAGTVSRISPGGVADVAFEDGKQDYGYLSDLELIDAPPAPAIPDEIEINGAKYRRVIEEVAPEKPEPKAGQVWKNDGGDFVMLTDEGENVQLSNGVCRHGWDFNDFKQLGAFIAPTLADALERGLITAADLR